MKRISINWHGPFNLTLPRNDNVILTDVSKYPGVYIWSALVKGEHWAYYVGETGTSFAQRHCDHLRCYFTGEYRSYHAEKFLRGEKDLVWEGAFGPKNKYKLKRFQENSDYYISETQKFISLLHFFLIPFNRSKRLRERLEAEISFILMNQHHPASGFQDSGIRYWPTRKGEDSVEINLDRPIPIIGLEDKKQFTLMNI